MKYLIILLLLSSCSLKHGSNPTPHTYLPITVVNKPFCNDSFIKAQAYLLSHGVVLHEVEKSDRYLVCLPTPSWVFRNLNLFYIAGLTGGNVSVTTDDPKVILHELFHLFVDLKHSWDGLMFPIDNPFATGFTEEQLERLKR